MDHYQTLIDELSIVGSILLYVIILRNISVHILYEQKSISIWTPAKVFWTAFLNLNSGTKMYALPYRAKLFLLGIISGGAIEYFLIKGGLCKWLVVL